MLSISRRTQGSHKNERSSDYQNVLRGHTTEGSTGEEPLGMRDQLAPELKSRQGHKRPRPVSRRAIALALAASSVPITLAQNCISLAGSTQCSAFNSSFASTSTALVNIYPFLAFVSSTEQFDQRLSQYVTSDYVQTKYQQLIGCNNVTLKNTTDYYARYTTSVICNAIVQNSIGPCKLSVASSPPLCADSCAKQAISEEEIAVNTQLCGRPNANFMAQIRADFTNCALPSDSLSKSCITGEQNEPNNCGFSTNLMGLCGFCATSSPNATDSCCILSEVTKRCNGVTLPALGVIPPLFPSSTSSAVPAATDSASTANGSATTANGLSGGQIAGIVVGTVVGAALLLGLLFLCCIYLRRRRQGSQRNSVFDQTSPKRGVEPVMAYAPRESPQPAPGGRVARMTALEGTSADGPAGLVATTGERSKRYGETSDSDPYGESPPARGDVLHPATGRRQGSLSSNSVFGGRPGDDTSPHSGSGGQFSSPEGVASGQSEQLPAFKDYYSQDEIHPNDKVATLWAYQPRASDEFELERGDMLRVVGIWDDGWATGVRINEHAEDYIAKDKVLRDSGVSQGTGRREQSPPAGGEIKAFPLVCVCLPQHWRKTVEGDSSNESASGPGFGGF